MPLSPGLPRFSNVCRLRITKTRTERGRPGTEANVLTCVHLRISMHVARAIALRVPRRSRVNAIAMSSYSAVCHVYHGASSRRDRELKYSSQPIAKNQATMIPKAWISTGDSSLCGHLLKTLKLMTVPLTHRRSNCAKAFLYKK